MLKLNMMVECDDNGSFKNDDNYNNDDKNFLLNKK